MKAAHLHHDFSFDYLSKVLRNKTHKTCQKSKPKQSSNNNNTANISYVSEISINKKVDQSLKNSQRDFINSIIHELKNPLNSIVGFSALIKDEVKNPKSVDECLDYANEIEKAALDLNELICDLLEAGSAAEGNFSVDMSREIDVADIIKRSVRLNYDFGIRRKIAIKSLVIDELTPIKLDAKRIKQILSNLISNAIKYSPENTEVVVLAKNIIQDGQKLLQIIVTDQGFGMDSDQVKTAFEKYQTVENPNSGIVDSFGLGLPITKQLVELQNGKISVKSEVGKGSEFILEFPYLLKEPPLR